ncbi:MAG: hypothetical protein WEE36_05055 [Acidimicrobiia bacterium]
MNHRHFRTMMLVLALALAGVVGLAFILAPDGEEPDLPGALEAVFPLPGDAVVRQTAIQIDLPIGYAVEIEVDGIWIPPHEIGLTEATGEYRWQPSTESVLPFWEPGDHTVTIRWDRVSGGRPDPGEFTWTFRVF